MRFLPLLAVLPALFSTVTAQGNSTAGLGPLPNGKYEIVSEGIRADFIPYGASISNLFINDTRGIERDIVLGFDNASWYSISKLHPYLGAVPGRYANRIKNSSFDIDGVTYHVLPNENNNNDTLHGGPDGWTWRNWTVVSHTTDSITFSLDDPDGMEGFPGRVITYVTYTLTPYQWHIKMTSTSLTKKTPIMLSSHTYWNLDGFQNPATPLALNYSLYMPYSGQTVAIDNIEIPTGVILPAQQYSPNDFWSAPKQLGANITSPEIDGNCGYNCSGYDNCFLVNRDQDGPYDWRGKGPVVTLASPWSGIQIDVFTDQEALQVYSCNTQNGTLTIKETQGLRDGSRPRTVQKYGCVVLEVEDWIDGINQPEWGREKRQIFGPEDDPYVLEAVYKFSVNSTLTNSSSATA